MEYLNHENIAKSIEGRIEFHPLHPCIDSNTKILFLGSFPPPRKRWAKGFDFFYPNFINDHWRIMGLIFFGNKDNFTIPAEKTYCLARIIDFVHAKGIGYYDTSEAVRRLKDNASDKFLEVVQKTDIRRLTETAGNLAIICTTGEKATQNICDYFEIDTLPKVNTWIDIPGFFNKTGTQIKLYRLPSSSRAYPMALSTKAEHYAKMFEFAEQLRSNS